jgi:hypothetical protein
MIQVRSHPGSLSGTPTPRPASGPAPLHPQNLMMVINVLWEIQKARQGAAEGALEFPTLGTEPNVAKGKAWETFAEAHNLDTVIGEVASGSTGTRTGAGTETGAQ